MLTVFILTYFRLKCKRFLYLLYNFHEIFFRNVIMYKRIRDLREDHDLNQTQVAKMLQMSQTGYSKYETGENDIPTYVLVKLADFYDVSVDYLLERTANPKTNR